MNTLVLHDELMRELLDEAQRDVEVAGVLLVRVVETPGGNRRFLGRSIRWVPENVYLHQSSFGLEIPPTGYIAALSEAEHNGEVAIWFHTHPGRDAVPRPSIHDREVDRQIAELFRIRSGSPYYGTLILSPRTEKTCAFTGTIQHLDRSSEPIGRLWIVGDRWRLVSSFDSDFQDPAALFDRNVRAFGPAMQQVFGGLQAAIIRCRTAGPIGCAPIHSG